MEKDGIYEDLSLILGRTKKVAAFVAVLCLVLLFMSWKIQILDHKKYWALAEANRTRESVVTAPRGLISDRQAVILAENSASFKASIIRENRQDHAGSVAEVSRLLKIEPEDLEKRIAKYETLPSFQPIVVKDNLALEEVSRIESRRLELPELIVETDPRRYYPFGSLAAHVIGYLQELFPEELRGGEFKGKYLGDLVGRTGVEREYEFLLVGQNGKRVEIVDSVGRSRGEVSRVEPTPGRDLRLTLDFDLQQRATQLLEGREGAIVV
ncbi:MAG: penicillin-binding protein 2, partial [Acidobacteriota bacterium]